MGRTIMDGLSRGELAKQAEVNIETLRFYERKGLLPEPPRTASNYRLYPEDAVQRVRFIQRAQDLGFSLKEIVELLSLRAKPREKCVDVRERAEAKIEDIDQKINALKSMRKALAKLVMQCSGRSPATECPILEAMESGD